MAELVDAIGLGPIARNGVQVRVLFPAHKSHLYLERSSLPTFEGVDTKLKSFDNTPMSDDKSLPPPIGSSQDADKYLNKLIDLIKENRILVTHTDLEKLDPSNIADHYRIDLNDYDVEISHSKQANSGQDFYVLLFNNIKKFDQSCDKVILAYIHLTQTQFQSFKSVSDSQIEKRRQEEERKRFAQALSPIDSLLEDISKPDISENPPEGASAPTSEDSPNPNFYSHA